MKFVDREEDRDIHDKSSAREGISKEKERNLQSTFNIDIDEERTTSQEVDEDDTRAQNGGENTIRRKKDDCY